MGSASSGFPIKWVQAKSIFTSKTFWASIVMLLAGFFPKVYGIIFGAGTDQTVAVNSTVQAIGMIVGAIGVWYGRIAATVPVTVTGGPVAMPVLPAVTQPTTAPKP